MTYCYKDLSFDKYPFCCSLNNWNSVLSLFGAQHVHKIRADQQVVSRIGV